MKIQPIFCVFFCFFTSSAIASSNLPYSAYVSMDEPPLVGEAVRVICKAVGLSDFSDVSVSFDFPEETKVLSGAVTWEGTLHELEPVEISAVISFTKPGVKTVLCHVVKHIDGQVYSGGDGALELSVGETESFFGLSRLRQNPPYIHMPELSPPQYANLTTDNPAPDLNEIVALKCSARQPYPPVIDDVRLAFEFPGDAVVLSEDSESWPFTTQVRFQSPGTKRIQCRMFFRRDGGPEQEGVPGSIDLVVGEPVPVAPDPPVMIRTLPSSPTITPDEFIHGRPPATSASPQNMTVQGHWKFTDRTGAPTAIWLTVDILRADTYEQLASCVADPTQGGLYTCGPFEKPAYVKLISRASTYIRIKNDVWDEILQVVDPRTGRPYAADSTPTDTLYPYPSGLP